MATEHAKCDSEKQDKIEEDLNKLVTEHAKLATDHAKCESEKQTLGREKVVCIRSCIGVCVLWGTFLMIPGMELRWASISHHCVGTCSMGVCLIIRLPKSAPSVVYGWGYSIPSDRHR